jgi:mono/diheme cytochrome c family protein
MNKLVWLLAFGTAFTASLEAMAEPESAMAIYGNVCSACHGSTFEGDGRGPTLKGNDFLGRWSGKTAYDLYTLIVLAMPADNPGVITEEDGFELVQLILKENGYEKQLKAVQSPEDLNKVVIK